MGEKILVVGPSWIGDMVMAQSLFMTLARLDPAAQIHVLAPSWTLPLLERMPEVSRAIALPFGHGDLDLPGRRALGLALRAEQYDRAMVLPNALKSALVPWFAGIPRRTGWRGEMRYGLLNDLRVLDKRALPLMIDRFNALAFEKGVIGSAADFPQEHPFPQLVIDQRKADATRHAFQLGEDRPVLALCPGAEFGPAKRWPPEKYAELAAGRIAAGWQVWLFGSAKEAAVCTEIEALLDDDGRAQCRNLAGRTSLSEAIELMSFADVVVSNDSGLMHVAAALNRPLVAVYGSTSPDFTPPLAHQRRVVRSSIECSPCFARECPLGHMKCLNDLPAGRVEAALCELGARP